MMVLLRPIPVRSRLRDFQVFQSSFSPGGSCSLIGGEAYLGGDCCYTFYDRAQSVHEKALKELVEMVEAAALSRCHQVRLPGLLAVVRHIPTYIPFALLRWLSSINGVL